jgi:hypothetical protein
MSEIDTERERRERQFAVIGQALNAMTDRFHAIERRLYALEAALSIRRGSVATSGGDSDPATITEAEPNAPR